jgi:protein dithiol:quinone oxidoreductase
MRPLLQQPRLLWAAIGGLSILAVAMALVSQHVFGMEPCPWCVLQRAIFLAIALACGVGALWATHAGRRTVASVVFLLSGCGVAAALWQHFVAAASSSCNLTLADKIVSSLMLDSLLPDVFSPRASCADAAVDLLGLPYEFWSLGLFILIGAAAVGLYCTRATLNPSSAP